MSATLDVQFLKMLEFSQNHSFARYTEIPDDVTTVTISTKAYI